MAECAKAVRLRYEGGICPNAYFEYNGARGSDCDCCASGFRSVLDTDYNVYRLDTSVPLQTNKGPAATDQQRDEMKLCHQVCSEDDQCVGFTYKLNLPGDGRNCVFFSV